MLRLKGKTQLMVATLLMLVTLLILYKISLADTLHDSQRLKDDEGYSLHYINEPIQQNDASALVQKVEDVRRRANDLYHFNGIHKNMIDEDKIGRRMMAPGAEDYLSEKSDSRNVRKSNKKLFPGYRYIHLDLKGAPPKVTYFTELFKILRDLGATGLLIEYEDMFPYSGHLLKDVAAYNAYTKSDVQKILEIAKENELKVIPLIQTFGHMEFILKLEKFSYLREVQRYPQVICSCHNDTFPLLTSMIDEILALHPDAEYLHIGCDEVYYLGECNSCSSSMMQHVPTKSELFLNHVIRLAKYVKTRYPSVTPLTWDDEFRSLREEDLRRAGVGRWLEPVIWKYTPDINAALPPELWDKYSAIFPAVWIASAFKGATGPDKLLTDISYHLDNHRAWIDIFTTYSSQLKFRGLMITGWQRYDHFSVLCELLPAGLPSLATCLTYVTSNDKDMTSPSWHAMETLHCEPPLPMQPGTGKSRCSFTGSGVLDVAERVFALKQNLERVASDPTAVGWLSPYNIQKGFSSPSHVEHATAEVDRMLAELKYISRDAQKALSEIYDEHTVSEWMDTYINPLQQRLVAMSSARERLLDMSHWPRRPLDVRHSSSLSQRSNYL
ncbi:hexosaminidase D-like [Schistocerca nitens]|uniref:hexosaminidase D-like n=1 Tax=Schistocerca nitens TaxID=7011 RepID=UPI0021177803|nr:hexosaminidase D-like [Schistocerca nitens]